MEEITKKIIKKINKYKTIVFILFLGIIFVNIFSKIVPYNMDEFIHYHQIACHHYEYNEIQVNNDCHYLDLNLLNTGLILPLRTYFYSGSFPCLYYYPLFLIWKSPLSARFMGIIFLLIQALILGKIFKIKYEYIFIGLVAFFPYFFQHIVDTGPVGFQITSIFIIYYFFIKWFKDFKIVYPISISTIIFLGIWTKLSYFWLILGITIIFLIYTFENKKIFFKKIKKILVHTAISTLLLISLLSLIFLSKDLNSNYYPYLDQLINSDSYSLSEIFSQGIFQTEVFKALINPFEATQRIYHTKPLSLFITLYDIFIYFSLPLLLFFLFYRANKNQKKQLIKPILFFFIFIITFLFILKSKGSWAMHHTILSFPFLILGYLSLITYLRKNEIFNNKLITGKRGILSLFLLFILLNSYFFILFPTQKIYLNQEDRKHNDFSKNKLNEVLYDDYLSKHYFYVVIDWGMYYIQGLYGNKNQGVIHLWGLSKKSDIDKLKNLSKTYNRKILFIYNSESFSSDKDLIIDSFNLTSCGIIRKDSVWNIMLESDENKENICLQRT